MEGTHTEALELFIINIYNKNKSDLFPIERYCKDLYEGLLLSAASQRAIETLKYKIPMYDVFLDTYNVLLRRKISIIELSFTDGNIIYVEKNKLMNILFFKDYLEQNDITQHNCIITNMPLLDVLDDFHTMCKVITFVDDGIIYDSIDFDYITIYKLVLIDNYLLEVISDDNVRRSFIKNDRSTLRQLLLGVVKSIYKFYGDDVPNYTPDYFNILDKFYKILNVRPQQVPKSIINKHNDDFIKSDLYITMKLAGTYDL